MTARTRSRIGPILALVLLSVAALPLAGADAVGAASSDEAELMRQIEEAARLERTHRAAQEEAAARDKADREARRQAEEAAQAARERSAAAQIERQIAEQEGIQGDLIWAANGRAEAREAVERTAIALPFEPDPDVADPRIATLAPKPRRMPREIFDAESIEAPAGRFGNAEPMPVIRLQLDADGDGKPELVRYLERRSELMIRQEEDRNYDGVIDATTVYEAGELVARVLDSNDDGNPDVFERYASGRLVSRELDRDDDGVRDVHYRYRGDSLQEEKHDANNDGVIDLIILYEDRRRVRTEEDADRDGRMDVWISYAAEADEERVVRIERDRNGRGLADTFEYFDVDAGRAVLQRREEDVNGDGEIDVVSFYVDGRLRRRQIANPDVVPL